MVTIVIRFPTGRYHATPWGRHVNEGVVEWPPNPWRLLRALVAVGFSKLHWEAIPENARQLVLKLAEGLPEYHLPRGEIAHTRHYMPNGSFHPKQKNLEATDKVLDTFVRLRPNDPLLVRWFVELTKDETELLARLIEHLNYFGRAESWAEASVFDEELPDNGWSRPSNNSFGPEPGGDQVALLACQSVGDYARWRDGAVASMLDAEERKLGKKPTKNQAAKATAMIPADLIECLSNDTETLQKQGWSQPPGSRRVLYDRPMGTLTPRPQRRLRGGRVRTVEAALLALSSDSVRGDRLPLMTRAVRQGEFIHQALVSILNKQFDVHNCFALTGRDGSGRKLEIGHQHAHFFPLDLDDDRRIDHVLVYAPAGLDETAQRAITRLRRTWTKGSDVDIFVTCAGFGDLGLFRRQLCHHDLRRARIIPAQPSRHWSSYTPYVPARYLKLRNNRYTLADDVRRELKLRGLPTPKRIEEFRQQGQEGKRQLVEKELFKFARTRMNSKPQPPQPFAFGVSLLFEDPEAGPFSLGYGCHFGLGLFRAEMHG